MIAFRVRVNGKQLAIAGLPGAHVVSSIITSVVRDEAVRRSLPADVKFQRKELTFSLTGLIFETQEHVNWASFDLKPGDTIQLEVIETDQVDEPRRRHKTAGPIEPSKRPRKKSAVRPKSSSSKKVPPASRRKSSAEN